MCIETTKSTFHATTIKTFTIKRFYLKEISALRMLRVAWNWFPVKKFCLLIRLCHFCGDWIMALHATRHSSRWWRRRDILVIKSSLLLHIRQVKRLPWSFMFVSVIETNRRKWLQLFLLLFYNLFIQAGRKSFCKDRPSHFNLATRHLCWVCWTTVDRFGNKWW